MMMLCWVIHLKETINFERRNLIKVWQLHLMEWEYPLQVSVFIVVLAVSVSFLWCNCIACNC